MDVEEYSKQFYKIKEVAEIVGVPQSTLRFWEKEFPTRIKPVRNPGGQRYYRPSEIETIRMIHYLLKTKGMKIDAVREYMRSNPHNVSRRLEVLDELKGIRNELAGLLRALGGRKL